MECIIGATAVGPTLHFGADSSKLSLKADIAFGNIDVLQVKPSVPKSFETLAEVHAGFLGTALTLTK